METGSLLYDHGYVRTGVYTGGSTLRSDRLGSVALADFTNEQGNCFYMLSVTPVGFYIEEASTNLGKEV